MCVCMCKLVATNQIVNQRNPNGPTILVYTEHIFSFLSRMVDDR